LDDFGIPLKLSHTVVGIQGKKRVEAVTIARVEKGKPVPGTEITYPCDTLLLSTGLIPENELSRSAGVELSRITSGPNVNECFETNVPGIFACGNVLHVHDLVDYVSEEAAQAGKAAAEYVKNGQKPPCDTIPLIPTDGVRYTVPVAIRKDALEGEATIRMRVDNVYQNKYLCLYKDQERLVRRKRMIMAPGEMETIKIDLAKLAGAEKITLRLED
jgi:pyruvate/2-oxoglutarate dehydrogenase complex dihydrolipoamide dehydrogenase (E3) component